jgi:hypothetical protein
MYCPSCDKSYGAVHSRCPECHSWLKVSAPSSARKAAKTGSVSAGAPAPAPTTEREQGAVSTLEPGASSIGGSDGGWADPVPSSPSNWGDSDGDDWSTGGLGKSGATAASSGSDGWGGASSAGKSPSASSSWSGNDDSEPMGWAGSDSVSASTTVPAPASKKDSGWLDGGGEQDGWGGGSAGTAGAAPVPSAPKSGGGWLGGDGPPEPSSGGGAPKSGGGWLGGDGPPETSSQGSGWLGESSAPSAPPKSGGGGGWLNGDGPDDSGPSMTEMVDQAISVEESDDFVDDSWVDEEIRDNDFDELDIPEYAPPAPEVGGAFLKMLLVAVLVLLVGGGILFANNDTKDPGQAAADETAKSLEFGRATMKAGQVDLEAGKPGLAIPQFEEALVALSEGKAPQDEIYQTEVLLGRALMGDEEFEEAYKHWVSLRDSGQEKYVAEAKKGVKDSSRELRVQANSYLADAKKYAAKDEITSVKRLGRDALALYEEYSGSRAQLGDAHGVIGRGHLNGREYAQAKDEFKKAVALAPGAGYEAYLKQANAALQPAQYIPPMKTAPRTTRSSAPKPSFDLGSPQYTQSSGRRGRGRSRGSSQSSSSGGGGTTAAPKKPMKEIPAYRPSKGRSSSGNRKGSKGVIKGY